MANGSFKKLLAKAKERDEYWVAKAISDFTDDLHRLMELRDVNKAELARRIESSPAYITKVMRGDTNFTVESMVRLARALDGQLCIHVGRNEDTVRWFDVFRTPVMPPAAENWVKVEEIAIQGDDDEPSAAVA